MLASFACAQAPPAAEPPKIVAGVAVNYDEALTGTYRLPDPLVLANGKPVRDAKTWTNRRRPEIVRLSRSSNTDGAPANPPE